MVLELAENRRGKYVYVPEYKRNSKVKAHRRRKPKALAEGYDPYIYIPAHLSEDGEGYFLREDHLDGLSDRDWNTFMELVLDHQPAISELSGKGKARREAKRAKKEEKKAARAKRKADKNERKNKKNESKNKAREAKAEAKRLRGEGKLRRGENAGGRNAEDIFDSVVNKASDVYGKFKGTRGEDDEEPDDSGSDDAGSGSKKGSKDDDTILGMPKMVAYGLGTAAALGLILVATKGRRQAA